VAPANALTRVLPYVTVVFAAFVPLAAAIYLLTTVAWTLAERGLFVRRTARGAKLAGRKLRLAGSQDGDPE
jgi:YidC/Oxa1 family membrane protein insertase